jgi:2-hydroxychromene-2-carboxylate isomerase
MPGELAEIKMYSDYKSPYSYLAFDPGMALEQKYEVRVCWRPLQLKIEGAAQRSAVAESKIKYLYLDARRWASLRPGGLVIKGPVKVYDSTPSLIGGLYAETQRRLVDYSRSVFEKFFKRELEIDQPDAVASHIASLGLSEQGYRDYLAGEGKRAFAAAQAEAVADKVFGVPLFVFNGEPFWGHDRIPFLEHRLAEAGLARDASQRVSPEPRAATA